METFERLMAELPFFEGLRAETLRAIAGCASNVRFEAGAFVGRLGDAADHFWVVREGSLAVEIHVPERGAIGIHRAGVGDVVGFSWLLPPHELRFDVRAAEPTRALMFDGRCLRGKCAADPATGYELLSRFSRLLAQRIEETGDQLLELHGERRAEA